MDRLKSLFRMSYLATAALAALGLSVSLGAACADAPEPPFVRLGRREPRPSRILPNHQSHAGYLRVALGAMVSPQAALLYYEQFWQYVGSHVGVTAQVIGTTSYNDLNGKLQRAEVDAAFVCAYPYVLGRAEFDLELLAAPQVNGGTVYYAYIIVPASSNTHSLAELRGKRFGFTDLFSNSGRLAPVHMLLQMHESPGAFFASVEYTQAHDKSIRAVAEELLDGASVDSLIWDNLEATDPTLRGKTRVVQRSEPFGIPPVVVRPGLDGALKEKLRQTVLTMHHDPQGMAILKRMGIEQFVTIGDGAYDSIRAMAAAIDLPHQPSTAREAAGARQGAAR